MASQPSPDISLIEAFGERRDRMLASAGARPILLVAVGILAFSVWDAWLDRSALARTFPIRLAAAVFLLLPYLLLRRRIFEGIAARWLHGSVFLIGMLGTTAATLQLHEGFLWGAAGITVFPIVLAIYPLPPRWYLGFNFLAALGIIAMVGLSQAPVRQLANFFVMYGLALWVGWNALHVLRKQQWRVFVLEQEHATNARTDALTGLFNRRHIEQLGRRDVDSARKLQRPFALLMIDLDHFKQINDQRGHDAGDQALRLSARALGQTLRSVDQLGRWGGEEFLALLPDTDGPRAAQAAARCLEALRAQDTKELGSPPLRLSASIGVAAMQHDESFEELIQRADRCLYSAKSEGRDRYCLEGSDAHLRPVDAAG